MFLYVIADYPPLHRLYIVGARDLNVLRIDIIHGKALDVLSELGMDAIRTHDAALNRRLIDGLQKLGMKVYGDTESIEDRVGVVSFNDPVTNSHLLARKIGQISGIAVRRGAFCAHPYVWRLMGIPDDEIQDFKKCTDAKTPGMIRVSFGIYNTEAEVDEFLRILPLAIEKAQFDQILYSDEAPAGY